MGTIDKQVGASGDDGYWITGGGFSSGGLGIWIGDNGGPKFNGFFRFTGVTIPAGATITAATLELNRLSHDGSGVAMKVYGVDEEDPAAPTSRGECEADPRTTAAVDWDADFEPGWNTSPSLVDIIQELVDAHSFSNSALMLQVVDDGSPTGATNGVEAYDDETALAAKLHIEYTEAASGWPGLRGTQMTMEVIR